MFSNPVYAIYGYVSDSKDFDFQRGIVAIEKLKYGEWKHACSGTIAKSNLILTAAHCFDDKSANVRIRYNNEIISSQQIWIHKSYLRQDLFSKEWGYVYEIKINNDLALIEVANSFCDNDIIVFPDDLSDVNSLNNFISAGYGQVANQYGMGEGEGIFRVSIPMKLTKVDNNRIYISDSKTGICLGDSGGPLFMLDEKKTLKQVGISSQGNCMTFSWFERISQKRMKKQNYVKAPF